jgi:predicted enzyme related to lactoylglutathione lyase
VRGADVELDVRNVVSDCNDLAVMRRFWGAITGFTERWSNATYVFMLHEDGRRPGLVLQEVTEPAREKNRLHLDLNAPDVTAAIEMVKALGGTFVEHVEEEGINWSVMCDPEGNYFCIQQPPD